CSKGGRKSLRALAECVNREKPWLTPDAARLDGQSILDWATGEGITSRAVLDGLNISLSTLLGGTAESISALWFGWYVASNDSWRALESVRGGAQDSRFRGGAGSLAMLIADKLGPGRVRTDHAVLRVTSGEDGRALIETRQGSIAAD